ERIVCLSADLAKYTALHIFRDAMPERFYQIGMAEQALLGAATGLAMEGYVPFASTYSVFATRRAYDFLLLDIAEANLNVNLVCALPGLTTGYGPSHAATEDREIVRRRVRGAVPGGQARQRAHQVHVEVRRGDVQQQEVVGAAGREHRVGGGEGDVPLHREPGGGAEQRLLGHPDLVEPLRHRVAEDVQVGVLGEVGAEADDPLVGLRGLDQGVA